MTDMQYYEGVGRRKAATARVRIYPSDTGVGFVVNDKPLEEYFTREIDQHEILTPLKVCGAEGKFGVTVKVRGGGVTGQAGAVRLGVARALLKFNPEYRKTLRDHGLLTRDPRAKERKKPGLKRARKAPQYTKR
ncbi:MAG: 30S ribosomal protein S9 [Chloroflexi bacterium]|nr:MAG: 30S ribosomal protein S9 [Chloroflexota bacterium]